MKTARLIERLVYTVVILLLLAVTLLIFTSPAALLEVNSVYQMF